MFEFVYGIDDKNENDEFVTADYKSLRDWTAGSVATLGEAVRRADRNTL